MGRVENYVNYRMRVKWTAVNFGDLIKNKFNTF